MTLLETIALELFITEIMWLERTPPNVNLGENIWFTILLFALIFTTSVAIVLRIEPKTQD